MTDRFTIKPKDSHLHPDCVTAGDCKSQGWCFGQTCGASRATRTATGRCRTCRTRIFNENASRQADPTVRDPEGL